MNQLHKGWSESQIHSMDDLDVYITDGIKYPPTSLPLSNQRPFRLKIQREDNLMKYTSRSEGGMDWRLPLVFSNKKVSGALNTSNRQADACQKYSSSQRCLKFSKRRRHIFGYLFSLEDNAEEPNVKEYIKKQLENIELYLAQG